MQGSEFSKIWLVYVNVEALTLVDVASSIDSHVDQCLLLDLPNSSELNILRSCQKDKSTSSARKGKCKGDQSYL